MNEKDGIHNTKRSEVAKAVELPPLDASVDGFVTWLQKWSYDRCTELFHTPSGFKYFVHPARVAPRAKTAQIHEPDYLDPSTVKLVKMDATVILPVSAGQPALTPQAPFPWVPDDTWRQAWDIFDGLDPNVLSEDERRGRIRLCPVPGAISFEILGLGDKRTQGTGQVNNPWFVEYWDELSKEIRKLWREALVVEAAVRKREGRPTPTTKRIFEVIKRLKEADPALTQDQAAAKASQELSQDIGIDTVRYVCGEMDYKWKRGTRRRW